MNDMLIIIFARISFWIMVVLFLINFKNLKEFFRVKKKYWILLIILLLVSFFMRLFLNNVYHYMYIDEYYYMKAGKNLLLNNSTPGYQKSIGWPVLISFAFRLFGINNHVALYTSAFFGVLTTLSMFLMTYAISKSERVSLISSAILTFLPLHLEWSGSAETNIVSVFFITLAVFTMFVYYHDQKKSLLYLSLAVISFACIIRPENHVLFLLFFAGIWIYNKKISKHVIIAAILALVLAAPNLIQQLDWYTSYNQMQSDSEGKVKGENWSLKNLVSNSFDYGGEVFSNPKFPVFITLFAVIGVVSKFGLFASIYLVLFWLVYFTSWLDTLGGRRRIYLTFYPVFIALAVLTIKKIAGLKKQWKNTIFNLISFFIILVILFQSINHLSSKPNDAWTLQTNIPEIAEKEIKNCTILTMQPIVFESTTNLKVINANKLLLSDRTEFSLSNECLLFFEDYYCKDWWTDKFRKKCDELLNKYDNTVYKAYKHGESEYTFYRIHLN